jgi:hypothetical protein
MCKIRGDNTVYFMVSIEYQEINWGTGRAVIYKSDLKYYCA